MPNDIFQTAPDVFEAARTRRSIRAYKPDPVPAEIVREIVALGRQAPSGSNIQPWRVHVRPPSFINLQALKQMSIGHLVADVVAIIGTLDIVLGEIDR